MLYKFLFLLFGLNCCSYIFAQTDSLKNYNDTTTLQSVYVTAFGISSKWKDAPAAVAVINQQRLQRFDNKTLVPVLNTVAGVRMEERSPGSYRLSIRGSLLRSPFGVRNIKVYWNDMPLTDPGGNTYLNLININELNSVEIIKGPASSVYGANTGGALLLHSTLPFEEIKRNIFNAGISGGYYGLLNEDISWQYSGKNFSSNFSQTHLQSDGYRQQSALHSDAIKWNGEYFFSSKEQLSALLFYTNLHYETPGGITKQQMDSLPTLARQPTATLPGAVQQNAGVYNKTGFAGLSLQSGFGKSWSNTTSVTINHTDFKNPFITNYEHRKELNYGARTMFELNASYIKWLTGAEFQQNISHIKNYANNGGNSGDLFYDDDVHIVQYFFFTQLNLQIKNFTVQGGLSANQQLLKYNRVSDSVYNYRQHQNTKMLLAPRLSLLYAINKTISLYAILSKGFSPPTLAEVRPSTNQFYNLQPEYGWNIEDGIKGSAIKNRLQFDASVYSFNLKHAIVQQQDSSGADYFVNAGGTKQTGVEIWLNAFLIRDQKQFVKGLSLSNSFAYQPYKFNNYISGTKDYSGNHLTGVPKTVNVTTLDIYTKPGIYLTSNFNCTSSIPLTDANDVYADAYKLLQAKLGFKKQFNKIMLDIYAGADNILNESYSLGNDLNALGSRYFNPAPKRNYFGGVRLEF